MNRMPMKYSISVAIVGWVTLLWTHGPRETAAASRVIPAPVVVELFTSEGCSSCPPADELLRRVAGKHLGDGQTIIALSEHVTYWNSLGWNDRFSDQAFTARQEQYQRALHLKESYTPQMVVDGRTQFVGSDEAAFVRALQAEAGRLDVALSISELKRDRNMVTVHLRNAAVPGGRSADLWAAVTDDEVMTEVKRGENAGHTLRHSAVVRSLLHVGILHDADEQTVSVPLPTAVVNEPRGGHHLTLFAQLPDQGAIVGAALAAL